MSVELAQTCFHCGQDVPPYLDLTVSIENKDKAVCCYGCKAAAEFIYRQGMGEFYQFRGDNLPDRPLIADQSTRVNPVWLQFDKDELKEKYLEINDAQQSITIYVQGIYCSSCGWLINKALSQLDSALSIQLNTDSHYLIVQWPSQSQLLLSQILHTLSQLGYQPRPIDVMSRASDIQALRDQENRASLKRLLVAGFGMMQVMSYAVGLYLGDYQGIDPQIRQFLHLVSLLVATVVVFYSGRPFFKHAISDVFNRHLGMDVPVAIAIAGAYFPSVVIVLFNLKGQVYFDSAVMFVFFLSLGRHLEMRARYQSSSGQQALRYLLPEMITVKRNHNQEQLIAPHAVAVGDVVDLQVGEVVPFDGVIVSGEGYLDQSCLNGEATPVLKQCEQVVFAGSIVRRGWLSVKATCVWADSSMAYIEKLLNSNDAKQAQGYQFMQSIARYFVLSVLLLTGVVATGWFFYNSERVFSIVLAMLIASCPCAFSLATPAVSACASAYLRRYGVLLANFDCLQLIPKLTRWCFDKTGTLTQGDLSIIKVDSNDTLSVNECLQIASALEARSEHILANSFKQIETSLQACDVDNTAQGVIGWVDGQQYFLGKPQWVYQHAGIKEKALNSADRVIALAKKHELLAYVYLSDKLRIDAATTLEFLKNKQKSLSVLSGDSQATVDAQFAALPIDCKRGDLLAEDKLEYIKQCQLNGDVVAMVGDGVNDAPVLGQADVSIALASGSQLSQSQSDVILLGSRLQGIKLLYQVSIRAQKVIKQNVTWAIVYNCLVLPLAALGYLTPWIAAIGMSVSSLLVVLNARRIT